MKQFYLLQVIMISLSLVPPAQAVVTYHATYPLNGGTASQPNQTYTANATDTSGVWVTNAGNLTMTNCTVTTSGNTSSQENSSFYGLNAGVLVTSGNLIMAAGSVTTTGTGANGIFAYGNSASINVSNLTVNCSADGAHAVMASGGGKMDVSNVNMTTAGANAGAIATDRGGGTITVLGGTITTSGANSPGIYSTGNITVSNAVISASGSESAVIEGANSITVNNTTLTSSKEDKWGVMIYQSMSGDASGNNGTFTMTGGVLTNSAAHGPLFYVTNTKGIIKLTNVTVTATSGTLIKAAVGDWGTSGANGGTATFTADGVALVGGLETDSLSSISATLKNGTTLVGSINTASLSLDTTSTWTVTADSYLAGFTDAGGVSGLSITNITGNGHNVYYNASLTANSWLGGKTYSLVNGGKLLPNTAAPTPTPTSTPTTTPTPTPTTTPTTIPTTTLTPTPSPGDGAGGGLCSMAGPMTIAVILGIPLFLIRRRDP